MARSRGAAIEAVRRAQPIFWSIPNEREPKSALAKILAREGLGLEDIRTADERLRAWSGALAALFPELRDAGGRIESPLLAVDAASVAPQWPSPGPALMKADHALPLAGSIKARGGVYEVIVHAEAVAAAAGLFGPGEDPKRLTEPDCRRLFALHTIAVGSTGNLGLSIGIMASALGFNAVVHMSHDAKTWKKDRLRRRGVAVIEHHGDYADAVAAGRAEAARLPNHYFVDDEASLPLFLGYATAAVRIARQLDELRIEVSDDRPLHVYLPCGVGGAPGGITFGLKHLFGAAVRCCFAEPVQSPCFLMRMLMPEAAHSVYEFELSNRTEADGLAVAQASELAFRLVGDLIDGCYTVTDEQLLRQVFRLSKLDIRVEPSAAAAFCGVDLNPKALPNATALFWSTGGSLVPSEELDRYIERGAALSGGD